MLLKAIIFKILNELFYMVYIVYTTNIIYIYYKYNIYTTNIIYILLV